MVINFVVLRLKETNRTVKYVQDLIKENPVKGFWVVSLFAFIVSPYLTNDGVCLLFVAPILVAFESINEDSTVTGVITISENMQLKKNDAVYFMLTLACSANIGSAVTYTGNPQVSLRFKGLFLYNVGIALLYFYHYMSIYINSIAYSHHTDIYPLLNISAEHDCSSRCSKCNVADEIFRVYGSSSRIFIPNFHLLHSVLLVE